MCCSVRVCVPQRQRLVVQALALWAPHMMPLLLHQPRLAAAPPPQADVRAPLVPAAAEAAPAGAVAIAHKGLVAAKAAPGTGGRSTSQMTLPYGSSRGGASSSAVGGAGAKYGTPSTVGPVAPGSEGPHGQRTPPWGGRGGGGAGGGSTAAASSLLSPTRHVPLSIGAQVGGGGATLVRGGGAAAAAAAAAGSRARRGNSRLAAMSMASPPPPPAAAGVPARAGRGNTQPAAAQAAEAAVAALQAETLYAAAAADGGDAAAAAAAAALAAVREAVTPAAVCGFIEAVSERLGDVEVVQHLHTIGEQVAPVVVPVASNFLGVAGACHRRIGIVLTAAAHLRLLVCHPGWLRAVCHGSEAADASVRDSCRRTVRQVARVLLAAAHQQPDRQCPQGHQARVLPPLLLSELQAEQGGSAAAGAGAAGLSALRAQLLSLEPTTAAALLQPPSTAAEVAALPAQALAAVEGNAVEPVQAAVQAPALAVGEEEVPELLLGSQQEETQPPQPQLQQPLPQPQQQQPHVAEVEADDEEVVVVAELRLLVTVKVQPKEEPAQEEGATQAPVRRSTRRRAASAGGNAAAPTAAAGSGKGRKAATGGGRRGAAGAGGGSGSRKGGRAAAVKAEPASLQDAGSFDAADELTAAAVVPLAADVAAGAGAVVSPLAKRRRLSLEEQEEARGGAAGTDAPRAWAPAARGVVIKEEPLDVAGGVGFVADAFGSASVLLGGAFPAAPALGAMAATVAAEAPQALQLQLTAAEVQLAGAVRRAAMSLEGALAARRHDLAALSASEQATAAAAAAAATMAVAAAAAAAAAPHQQQHAQPQAAAVTGAKKGTGKAAGKAAGVAGRKAALPPVAPLPVPAAAAAAHQPLPLAPLNGTNQHQAHQAVADAEFLNRTYRGVSKRLNFDDL